MREQWQAMKAAAQSRIHSARVPISGADVSFRMVDFARRNAVRAGVDHVITFNGGDALERPPPNIAPELHGTLMLNPPYGERIEAIGKAGRRRSDEDTDEVDEAEESTRTRDTPDRALPSDFHAQLAAHWKRAYAPHPGGWTAWVLSPDPKLPSALRLKESRRVPLWNGPIECRLFRFELVLGSAREKGAADAVQA